MVTIITCPLDTLSGEAQVLARRLSEADLERNIDVVHYLAEGQGHAWDKSARDGELSGRTRDAAYELAATRIQQSFAT